MCKKLFFLISFLLVLGLVGSNVAFGDVIEIPVADDNDDVEQNRDRDGQMYFTSSDLEILVDPDYPDVLQVIGLRFVDIPIPKGAKIVSAAVRFDADDVDDAEHVGNAYVIIDGELSPDAAAFEDIDFNVSSRTRTTAQVQWTSEPFPVDGGNHQKTLTADISSVIQEIVNQDGWAAGNALVLILSQDPATPSVGHRECESFNGAGDNIDQRPTLIIEFAQPVTITVEAGGDIAAANEQAKAGDTIEIAEGTYVLSSQILIKDGVTYRGAGPGLTIIDGNDVTRAFAAWGDRGATSGQVDANGVAVPNASGPKGWVLEGMTIQNCVADPVRRHDILGAARVLLNNYTADTPYTLEEAKQWANWAIWDNPGWFEVLSGGADDNLTDVELQAYLDNNPAGSDGHLVSDGDKDVDAGAINIDNGAVGTVANCEFLNNHMPAEGFPDDGGAIEITGNSAVTITGCTFQGNHSLDEGGAINITGQSEVTLNASQFKGNYSENADGGAIMLTGLSTAILNDCLFDGNYAVSPDSVAVEGFDGDGGHIRLGGSSASAVTPGTTLIANRCTFLNGNASDDGGAIMSGAVGSIIRLDACWFEANTSWDNGNVLFIGNESSGELTVTNCVFANNITKADNSPDRMCQVRRNSKFINCTFVGNSQDDQDLIYNNANSADTDADGVDDELADVTQVVNCIFVNNVVGNGDDVLGSRNDNFSIAATNCLFFNNTLQNGNAADNTQRPDVEVGSILSDPLLGADLIPGVGSPAIDAGIDPATVGVTLMNDYNGAARPQGAGYDIGAIEVGDGN